MSITWKYIERYDYTEVSHTGHLTRHLSKSKIPASLRKLIDDTRCYNFLIDYSMLSIDSSVTDIYLMGKGLFNGKLPHRVRIAFFCDHDEEKMDFLETVLRNRGFIVKAFAEKEDAIEWLIGEKRR